MVLMPTTTPWSFTRGPPELPALMVAVDWMRCPESRPSSAVTDTLSKNRDTVPSVKVTSSTVARRKPSDVALSEMAG